MSKNKNMTATEYMTIVYNSNPAAWPMYATLEEFLAGYAKHLAKKIVDLGVEDRPPETIRTVVADLEEVA